MEYSSISALKSALEKALLIAVDEMAETVEDKLDEAVMRYYQSYTPNLYDRTGTLSYAPQRTDARPAANGAEAEVYMDTSLHYRPGDWSMEQVITAADNLTHGGWYTSGAGVSIYKAPIKVAKLSSRQKWEKSLKDAGIPMK